MQTPCVNRRSKAFCLIGKIRGLRKEIALLKMTTTRDPCTGKFWRAARRRDPRFSGRLTGPFNSGSHVEKLMSSGRAQHVAAATPTHKPDVSPPARKKSPSPIEDNPELSGDGGPFSSFYDAQRSQGRNQVPFLLTKTAAFIYLFFSSFCASVRRGNNAERSAAHRRSGDLHLAVAAVQRKGKKHGH
jgi:hypothetical protein